MNFFEVIKNKYKAGNSNDARTLRGLLVARSIVLLFFAKKGDKIFEVRSQNYENPTIYVVQRITNMGYTTTYTALREGDTVQAPLPQKIIVVPFSQLDES